MTGKENTQKEIFFSLCRDIFLCLSIAGITLAVYWQVQHYDFVSCDDPIYVTENPYVQSGLTRGSFISAFTTTPGGLWIPLTWLSLMLDYDLYNLDPQGYHLTNLLLHTINIIILFFVLKRMTKRLGQSAFVAALFAIHPLHVESVAWITERKDVLSTLFWMLTMFAYARYAESPCINRYLPIFLFFALGLMAKPMLVTLPFVLLLLDYWPLGRLRFSPLRRNGNHQFPRPALFQLFLEKAPLFVLSVLFSLVTFFAQQNAGALAPIERISLKLRILNALVSYVAYIGKMIWPLNLAVLYPHPGNTLSTWQWALAGLFLVFISVLVIRTSRDYPFLTVGWLWYLGTLVPVSGLSQAGNQAMADRFTYIPSIGLFIFISWGIPKLVSRWRYKDMGLASIAAALLLILTAATWLQVRYWANSITLYEHTLAVTANNPVASNGLGAALARQGRFAAATSHYYEALRTNPHFLDAHNNLGIALAKLGRLAEAVAHYSEALRLNPEYADAHNNLGNALIAQGKVDEAIGHYTEALRINPRNTNAHNNIGNALLAEGRADEAIAHFSEALRLNPDRPEIHYNLGAALIRLDRTREAIGHFREALRINPAFARANIALTIALGAQGKTDDANKGPQR
jgi:tetratricopeptide (TPR) repeat protein